MVSVSTRHVPFTTTQPPASIRPLLKVLDALPVMSRAAVWIPLVKVLVAPVMKSWSADMSPVAAIPPVKVDVPDPCTTRVPVVVEIPSVVKPPTTVDDAVDTNPPSVERPPTVRVPVVFRLPALSMERSVAPVAVAKLRKFPEKPFVLDAYMRSPVVLVARSATSRIVDPETASFGVCNHEMNLKWVIAWLSHDIRRRYLPSRLRSKDLRNQIVRGEGASTRFEPEDHVRCSLTWDALRCKRERDCLIRCPQFNRVLERELKRLYFRS